MNTSRNFMRDRLPWIIAVVAVLAMAITMFRSRDDASSAAAGEQEIDRVMARLEALETRGRPNAGAYPGTAGGPAMPGRDGLTGSMREQKTPEQMAAERDRQMRDLEAQFARDAADPGAARVENTLEKTVSGETMAGTGLTPKDVDIACKRNSCRIVSSFAKMGDAQDWSLFYITAAGGNVLSQTQMVFVPMPDGSTQVRIYANRSKG
jgi:hypothetical protein